MVFFKVSDLKSFMTTFYSRKRNDRQIKEDNSWIKVGNAYVDLNVCTYLHFFFIKKQLN